MPLTTEQQILIETRIANEQKSPVLAYGLWFFLGIFSAHRFYFGKPQSAILQILSYLIIIGFIWWIVDAFLISSMLEEQREELRKKLIEQQRELSE